MMQGPVAAETCEDLPANAAAWWRGENNANDSVGGNHGALAGGATFADGKVGRGFHLDGADDVVEIPDNAAFTPGAAMTVEAWIRDANPAVAGTILSQYDSSAAQIGWSFSVLAGGQIQFSVNGGGSVNSPLTYAITTDSVVVADSWTHVAATYDTATEAMKIYVNGVAVEAPLAPGSSDLSSIHDSSSPVRIGASRVFNGSVTSFFSGDIDDVSLYWRDLSASEILAIFNAGEAGKCTSAAATPANLISSWQAEGNVNDSLGSNHGSLKNGAGYAQGLVGHAFRLDGSNDYVEVADSATLDGMAQVTVEGWVKFDGFPVNKIQIIACKGSIAGSGTTSYAIWHEQSSGNIFAAANTDTGGINTVSFGPFTDTSAFHHVAFTYDGVNIRLYVDGMERQSAALDGDVLDGLVDEISIYSRALSGTEIAAIQAAGPDGKSLPVGTTYSWFGGTDDWSNATRWTPQGIPGKNDSVVFSGNNLDLDIDAAVGDLTISAGALRDGGGSLTLHGTCEWTGGRMFGSATLFIAAGGELKLSGASSKETTSSFRVENSGSIYFEGSSDWLIGPSVVVVNHGLLEIGNDRRFDWVNSGGRPLIENRGTLRKMTATGTTTMEPRFYNSGVVDIQSGILSVSAPGSFMDGGSFIGAGTTRLNTYAFTFSGTTGGSSLELVSGLIEGSGTLADGMTWTGGYLKDSHSLTIGPDATLVIDGASTKSLSHGAVLNNMGKVEFNGTGVISTVHGGSVVNVGVFEVRNAAAFDYGNAGNALFFDNQGTLRKTTATGTTTLEGELRNSGAVDIQTGALNVTSHGAFMDGASFVGAGLTRLVGASATYTFTGNIGGSSLEFASGRLEGSGVLTGGMIWTGGLMHGLHSLTVGDGATLTLDGTAPKNMTGGFTLTNDGTIVFQDTGLLAAHSGPSIVNRGLFEIRNDATFDYVNAGANLVFDNQGVLRKTTAPGVTSVEFQIDNTGEVEVQTGALKFVSTFTQTAGEARLAGGNIEASKVMEFQGGGLSGAGTITGSVNNTGATVAPGTSAGALSITGNYTQGLSGIMAIEIGGTTQGTQFDHLSVGGTATLGGGLHLSRINAFPPASMDTFEILTSGSVAGSFSSITGTDAVGGNFFDPVYGVANVTLAVKDATPTVSDSSLNHNAGQFGFQITGIAEQTYVVQGTRDFVTWTDVETRTLANPIWDFVDPNPDSLTYRFYRTVFLPQ